MAPPVISLAGLRSGNLADRALVGAQIRAACLDKGFFYITDHGVPAVLMEKMLAETRRFFSLPADEKHAVSMKLSDCNRGYEPAGVQTLEAGAPPDLKEGFYIGPEIPRDDPRAKGGLFNHGPNLWPANLPGWRDAMEEYYAAMLALSAQLMGGLALALQLPETHFEDFCRAPYATLRLLHYPPQPPNPRPDEKGCGAHTDFGAITILLQDGAGGLQVHDSAKGWVDAPPMNGSFVVNLGDMIARWTNDHFRSTLHRVINMSGHDRTSVPFFYDGNPNHEVTCLLPGETPKYPPTTPLRHLQEMYERIYEK